MELTHDWDVTRAPELYRSVFCNYLRERSDTSQQDGNIQLKLFLVALCFSTRVYTDAFVTTINQIIIECYKIQFVELVNSAWFINSRISAPVGISLRAALGGWQSYKQSIQWFQKFTVSDKYSHFRGSAIISIRKRDVHDPRFPITSLGAVQRIQIGWSYVLQLSRWKVRNKSPRWNSSNDIVF